MARRASPTDDQRARPVTFMGLGMSDQIADESWDENNFGMNVMKCGQSWDLWGSDGPALAVVDRRALGTRL